jgi:hypothetical protein
MLPYTGTRVIYREPDSAPMFWDEPAAEPTHAPTDERTPWWDDDAPRWIGADIVTPEYCNNIVFHRDGCPKDSGEPPF